MESTWGPGTSRSVLRGRWTCVVIVLAAVVIAAATAAARASAAPLTEFNLPAGAKASSLIAGPDGALWFGEMTAAGTPALGRITTAGTITSKPVSPTGDIGDLAVGANGTIWFTLIDTVHAIGELSSSGQVTLITP